MPEHHWVGNTLSDADQYPGCSPANNIEHPTPGWTWELTDGQGVIAAIDTAGRGNVIAFVGRHPTDWRLGPLFVVLDTGEVWVLPGPHLGGTLWSAAP
jgi:hypothetical protein